MKKAFLAMFALLIVIAGMWFCSTFFVSRPAWPPEEWSREDFGSFSPNITYSYDNKYYAVQTLVKPEGTDAELINIAVYENGTDAQVDSFITERAFDFWGICWEEDTYNIWIQSADVGTYCMVYANGKWQRTDDPAVQMPDGMIDRFRMRQGSFLYVNAFSADGRFRADRYSIGDRVNISDTLTGEIVFSYPIDQIKDFKGVCWDNDNNLWLRSGDTAFALRYTGETWFYDDDLPRPAEVVFSYKWDGTPN